MDYINSHPELNAEMSFGTLQDYFNSVREASSAKTNGDPEGLFKTLSGDFFTYADRNDNYWSGLVNNSILFSWLFTFLQSRIRVKKCVFNKRTIKVCIT